MIHSTSSSYGSPRINSASTNGHSAASKRANGAETDSLSAKNSESLRESLKSSPEIRPEMVALGEKLAVDPNYPPRQIIEQLAKMFTVSVDPSEQA